MGALGPIRNPLGIEGFTSVYKVCFTPYLRFCTAQRPLSVFVRLRHAVGVERQQIKWFAYSAAIFAIGVVLIVITCSNRHPSGSSGPHWHIPQSRVKPFLSP